MLVDQQEFTLCSAHMHIYTYMHTLHHITYTRTCIHHLGVLCSHACTYIRTCVHRLCTYIMLTCMYIVYVHIYVVLACTYIVCMYVCSAYMHARTLSVCTYVVLTCMYIVYIPAYVAWRQWVWKDNLAKALDGDT